MEWPAVPIVKIFRKCRRMIRDFKVQWSFSCDMAREHYIYLRTRALISSLDTLVKALVKAHIHFSVNVNALKGNVTRSSAV